MTLFSLCYTTDDDSGYGTVIAVEIKVNGQFNDVVGMLEYTGRMINLVTFSLHEPQVIVLPQVFQVLEKTIHSKEIHHIKCQNQHGVITSGTIDFRHRYAPGDSIDSFQQRAFSHP